MQRDVEFEVCYTAKVLSSVSYQKASSPSLFSPLLPAVSQRLLPQNTKSILLYKVIAFICPVIHKQLHDIFHMSLPIKLQTHSLLQVIPAVQSERHCEDYNSLFSIFFSPQLYFFGPQVAGNALLREYVVSFFSL